MSAKKTNKDKKGSFIIQASVLAAASLIVRFIGFLYRLPLTALIGDRGNAIYSAGYYIYTFLLILSSAGLPAAISRLVSTRIAKGEYRNAQKIFSVLEEEYQNLFERKLTIKRLSDVIKSPRMPNGSNRVAVDFNLAPSVYMADYIERLKRLEKALI